MGLADPAGLDAVRDVQLPQEVGDVHARRLPADVQQLADLTVGAPGGELAEDLDLAPGQPQVVGQAGDPRGLVLAVVAAVGGIGGVGGAERDAGPAGETLDGLRFLGREATKSKSRGITRVIWPNPSKIKYLLR